MSVPGLRVTGATRVCGIVGTPLRAAQAPASMNALASRRGIDLAVIPIEIADDGLDGLFIAVRAWENLAGLVVTMAYKSRVLPLVDSVTPRAAVAGNVNVVRRMPDGHLAGDQLDGAAMVRCLQRAEVPVRGSRIALLGAGGVASSIAFALADELPAAISVINRSPGRAQELVRRLTALAPAISVGVGQVRDLASADLVINATSVGSLINPGLALPVELISARTVVADVVTAPDPTELLRAAAGAGCRVVSGMDMQRAQLDDIFAFLDVATQAAR